jgi:serine/threonine-protein kinase
VLPPSSVRSGIGAALDAVVLRGLEFEPADRFATAEAMALALRRAHGVASPVDIARWLERFAPNDLELAEERVRLFEQAPFAASADANPTSTPHVDWSAATTSHEHPRGGRARWTRWIGVGAIALGTAIVALAIGAKTRSSGTAATSLPSSEPGPGPSSVAASAPSSRIVEEADPGKHAVEPAVATAAAATTAPTSPRRAPRKATKSPCDPPYTIDANGHKHYHPNCF